MVGGHERTVSVFLLAGIASMFSLSTLFLHTFKLYADSSHRFLFCLEVAISAATALLDSDTHGFEYRSNHSNKLSL